MYRLLLSWAMHLAYPVESSGSAPDCNNSIHCIICRSIPSLNENQVEMCINVPQSLTVLTNAQPMISGECKWQFRREQWDCAGVTTPIIEEPDLKCKLAMCAQPSKFVVCCLLQIGLRVRVHGNCVCHFLIINAVPINVLELNYPLHWQEYNIIKI